MNKTRKYFEIAKVAALSGDSKDAQRTYRLGAVGIRKDGTVVQSNNVSTRIPHPQAHAEARLTRKLDLGSVIYLVRILSDGSLGNARPCPKCRKLLKIRGVRRCVYSIDANEIGIIEP